MLLLLTLIQTCLRGVLVEYYEILSIHHYYQVSHYVIHVIVCHVIFDVFYMQKNDFVE